MPDFSDPLLLLEGAEENIGKLEKVFEEVISENRARIVFDKLKNGNKKYKIILEKNIPNSARLILVSIINDLRHSLDQACCIAYEYVSEEEAPANLYFPFASTPGDLEKRLEKSFPAGRFPTELHDAILSTRPYYSDDSHEAGNRHLCWLSKVAQRKHRLVVKLGVNCRAWREGMCQFHKIVGGLDLPPQWDPVRDEMILCTTAPDGGVEVNDVQLDVFAALYSTGVVDGFSAIDTLKNFFFEAKTAVLAIQDCF